MNYCSECGATVKTTVPAGDNRERFVCGSCGTIHYQNPLIVAGCVVDVDGSILLCKRSIEPRAGFWTVPAGFMELGETLPEAAARETREEAMAEARIGAMIATVDVLQAHQVHVFFAATLVSPGYGAGDETLETILVAPDDIPWDDLAFPSVRIALEQHLRNQASGHDELLVTTAPRRKLR